MPPIPTPQEHNEQTEMVQETGFMIDGNRFTFRIRQQPTQARMSGFSFKDRRPLDPTPVLELIPMDNALKNFSLLVAQATLCNSSGQQYEPFNQYIEKPTNMTGSVVASCNYLSDETGSKSLFFVFPDLAICTAGEYRIRFSLFDLSKSYDSPTHQLASILSLPFTVYSPKLFPGMKESTPLMRSLAKQGERVRMRSGRD